MRAHNSRLRDFLARHGISAPRLAESLGVTRSAVNNKLTGYRGWSVDQAIATVEFLRQWDPTLTVEDLFGDSGEHQSTPAENKAA